MLSIFKPDHCIAEQHLHCALCAPCFCRVIEQKRSIVRLGLAGENPSKAILIRFSDLHFHEISFHDLGDQFDGVPPLAFSFCGERNPLHLEVGLHLLVTLDVLKFFERDQDGGEFVLDAVQ